MGVLLCALLKTGCRRLGLLLFRWGTSTTFCESLRVSQGVVLLTYIGIIRREFKKEIMLKHGVQMMAKSLRVRQGVVHLIYIGLERELEKEIMQEHDELNMMVEQHHTRGAKPIRVLPLLRSRPPGARVVSYAVGVKRRGRTGVGMHPQQFRKGRGEKRAYSRSTMNKK